MKLDRKILEQLPRALLFEIEENLYHKPLTQSERATQQRRILEEVRKHAAPGTRTDLAKSATDAKTFAEVVKRATDLVGRLYGESGRQVEKRLTVVAAAEAEPERFGPLVTEMDRTGKVNEAHAELSRIRKEESEAIPNNGDGSIARVIVGDFHEQGHAIANASVDLIYTDPPYGSSYVPSFGHLAQFGARVLIEGGSLITHCGHQTLPEVMALMTQHLTFHWSCAALVSQRKRLPGPGVQVGFHQLLWLTKNKRCTNKLVMDCVKSSRGHKITEHEWAEGTDVASYFIDKLSSQNSLIVDPFLGSGTTAIAALKTGRRFIGFEINPETARKAEARINRLYKTA